MKQWVTNANKAVVDDMIEHYRKMGIVMEKGEPLATSTYTVE